MKDELEKFVSDNRDSFDRKTPDPAVLNRVLEQMQAKGQVKPAGILIPFRAVRWAAACLILVACSIVFWTLQKRPETTGIVKNKIAGNGQVKNPGDDTIKQGRVAELAESKPAKRKSVDAVDDDLALRKQALLAKLKAKNVRSGKEVMFAGLNNMESPASRITAASEAYKLKNTGNDVVDALVKTLNNDPNANVRLAALDGLARFYRDGYVRKKLIASLKKQQDPLVQIALINLLTRMRESGILEELNKIVNDENTQKGVKDCAYSGIIQLRSS